MANNKKFLGRGLAYPIRLAPDGGFVRDIESTSIIQSSIAIILLTRPGERLWNREFGSNLYSLVHEPNSPTLWQLVKQEVFAAIDRWEPRIENIRVIVEPNPFNRFQLNIFVSYNIIATNTDENVVFPFFLEGAGEL